MRTSQLEDQHYWLNTLSVYLIRSQYTLYLSHSILTNQQCQQSARVAHLCKYAVGDSVSTIPASLVCIAESI